MEIAGAWKLLAALIIAMAVIGLGVAVAGFLASPAHALSDTTYVTAGHGHR